MSVFKIAKNLNTKLKSVLGDKESIQGLIDGTYHYTFKNPVIEEIKNQRASLCFKCEYRVDDFEGYKLKDEDLRISGKMCEICTCPLPKLLRQTSKSCKKNKWQ